jgi:hypothetical protein
LSEVNGSEILLYYRNPIILVAPET